LTPSQKKIFSKLPMKMRLIRVLRHIRAIIMNKGVIFLSVILLISSNINNSTAESTQLNPGRQQSVTLFLNYSYSSNEIINDDYTAKHNYLERSLKVTDRNIQEQNSIIGFEGVFQNKLKDIYYLSIHGGSSYLMPGGLRLKNSKITSSLEWELGIIYLEGGLFADIYRHKRFIYCLGMRLGYNYARLNKKEDIRISDRNFQQYVSLSGHGLGAGVENWFVYRISKRVNFLFSLGARFSSFFSLDGRDPQNREGSLFKIEKKAKGKEFKLLQFIPDSKLDNLDRNIKDKERLTLFIPEITFKIGFRQNFNL